MKKLNTVTANRSVKEPSITAPLTLSNKPVIHQENKPHRTGVSIVMMHELGGALEWIDEYAPGRN